MTVFSDLHLRAGAIIVVGTLIGSTVWFAVLLFRGVPATALLDAFLNISVVCLILTAAWNFFVKWGWRLEGLRLGGWLVRTPDLNGRWEGTYRSSYDNKTRSYVLEIRQTLIDLQCNAWGDEN